MTIYEIEGSRIVDSRSDDHCLFRDYNPRSSDSSASPSRKR
jgi:hypothetical protein